MHMIYCRWLIVNISNETQFCLTFEREWFYHGDFWDQPATTVSPFSHSSYSGHNTSAGTAGSAGVSGAVLFSIKTPNSFSDIPFSIAFSNPGTGPLKIRAEFSEELTNVWDRMKESSTHKDEKDIGKCQSTPMHVMLRLTSTPGNQARVTLAQVYRPIESSLTTVHTEFLEKECLSRKQSESIPSDVAENLLQKLKGKHRYYILFMQHCAHMNITILFDISRKGIHAHYYVHPPLSFTSAPAEV